MSYNLGTTEEKAEQLGKEAAIAHKTNIVILRIWNYELLRHEYTWEFWQKWQTSDNFAGWEEIHCIDERGEYFEGIPEELMADLEGCKS